MFINMFFIINSHASHRLSKEMFEGERRKFHVAKDRDGSACY